MSKEGAAAVKTAATRYNSWSEFYPFYLQEHSNPTNRRLHVIGTMCVVLLAAYVARTRDFRFLALLPLVGYGFAWVGHFVFEKNRPATFKYPFYSLFSDFVMFFQTVTFQRKF